MSINGLWFGASGDSRNISQTKHRPLPLLTWTTTVFESSRGGMPLSVAVNIAPMVEQDSHDRLISCEESSTADTLNVRFDPSLTDSLLATVRIMGGFGVTTTASTLVSETVVPFASVATRTTEYVLALSYAWLVEYPEPLVPSPKLQE